MSSNSRRSFAFLAAILISGGLAPAGQAARGVHPQRPPGPVIDDSTRMASVIVNDIRALYGGDDNFAVMRGLRYYVSYTIPGPDGATVRSWTETHYVWIHDANRLRIDTDEDSTIVIVNGDTTRVFRAGAWSVDPAIAEGARAQAQASTWLWRLPRALLLPGIEARMLDSLARDEPFRVRYRYLEPGLGRAVGTILTVTFAPPTYVMRTLHWYDPRTRAWFLLELADDRRRYDWTWPERRTLRASNAAGEPGPIIWTARIEDMQIEGLMPEVVLTPPGSGPGVVVVADSVASAAAQAPPVTPADSAASGGRRAAR